MSLNRRLDAIEKALGPADRGPIVATLASLPGRPRVTRAGLWSLIRNHPPRETGSNLDVLQWAYFSGLDAAERERPGLPDEDFQAIRLPHSSYCVSAEDWVRRADALIARGDDQTAVYDALDPGS